MGMRLLEFVRLVQQLEQGGRLAEMGLVGIDEGLEGAIEIDYGRAHVSGLQHIIEVAVVVELFTFKLMGNATFSSCDHR